MNEEAKKKLEQDTDGLATYEYLANHIDNIDDDLDLIIDNMQRADVNGQFTVSAIRYLFAINPLRYAAAINRLIPSAIDKDRERRYIGDLLQSLWGKDYADRADELCRTDDNFRRIYKRIYNTNPL